jgi:transforming growth factor-beta-induced protein
LSAHAQTTIYQTIVNSANHTLLEQAIDQIPSVVSDLDNAGADLTMFAPDDDAVNATLNELGLTAAQLLASPDLEDFLRYHVLSGGVASSALTNGQIETPLNNANTIKFTIDGTDAFANQALIDGPDIIVTNGALHSIDEMLQASETVADVAIDSPNHSTLVTAVIEARLLPALTDPFSTLTVFAPTDAAFVEAIDSLNTTAGALLANPDLADILLYHVLGTEEGSGDLSNGQLATPLNTANTAKVTIDGTDVFINHAQVTTPDVGADNGVVHVIDQVILPVTTVADVAIGTGNHTTLVSAVVEARLLPALTNPFDTLTVFAPDDAAFTESLNDLGITAGDLLADANLADILLYHVLGAEVVSGDLTNGQLATPLNAANTIKVTVAGNGDVFANQAQVTAPDVQADNGVVHVLDQAIFTAETVVDAAIDNGFNTLTVAVVTAELLPTLTDPFEEFTVFAPTDAAFTQYLTDEGLTAVDLLTSPNLTDILLYHTVGAEVLSTALSNGPVTTLNGDDVVVDLSNGVMINNATVVTADVDVDNGVVHAIDYVLDPSVASLDELTLEAIEVYPNPATNVLNVKDINGADYSIVNMSGQTVQSGTINSTSIEINSLEEGTYFINLQDENNIYRSRFVKM